MQFIGKGELKNHALENDIQSVKSRISHSERKKESAREMLSGSKGSREGDNCAFATNKAASFYTLHCYIC